jgi:hypothetical protein
MKLVMGMISRQFFYFFFLSGPMSVALNKTICLFIEKHEEYFSSICNPYLHIQQRIFDFKVKISWKTHFTLKVAILTI